MAQQTINVGAAPNDGTGTPLRTAFQYTNSNFTELYTAVGPSGNNIVVPGSATISGDLTVDTNTLKVDSANNRVGIGTATPAYPLDVNGNARIGTDGLGFGRLTVSKSTSAAFLNLSLAATSGYTELMFTNFNDNTGATGWSSYIRSNTNAASNYASDLVFGTSAAATGNPIERYKIASDGVATWSNVGGVAGTAMTLNATGLGVGTMPGASTGSSKIAVVGGATYDGNFDIIANFTNSTASAAKGVLLGYNNSTNNGIISAAYGSGTEGLTFWTHNGSSWGQRMELTATGNVGIGVTPSAWRSTNKAVQVGSYSSLTSSSAGDLQLFNNAYINSGGANIYQSNGFATRYEQYQGVHAWYTAPSGTAGNTISGANAFVQAMTLDASGNLILLSSNTPATLTTNGQLTVNATSNTNLRFSYRGSDGVTRVANITLA